jgi:leader peptidase (prepilin peptidase)/N-methyltransferase
VNAGVGVALGALGLPVGSFLNVVIDRVPDGIPVRATVDGEAHPPRRWLRVPVQPGLLGSDPAAARRNRWIAVEVATIAVFAAFGTRYGTSSITIPLLLLGAYLVTVSATDLEHLRIPDRITFPMLAASLPLLVAVSIQHHVPGALWAALFGAVAYFVLLLLPHLAYPRGMGFGDVKLAIVMGLYLGWLGWAADDQWIRPLRFVLYGLMLGCFAGVVFGIGHAAVTRRRGEFPFGPALALSCAVVAIWIP